MAKDSTTVLTHNHWLASSKIANLIKVLLNHYALAFTILEGRGVISAALGINPLAHKFLFAYIVIYNVGFFLVYRAFEGKGDSIRG